MNEMYAKREYLVLGWKTDPVKGLESVFEEPRSLDAGRDVERALALGSSFIKVYASEGKDAERLKREFAGTYARVGVRDDKGRYFDPPLLGGVLTYSVEGFVPTGEFHPIQKDRMLYRVAFKVHISANPRSDVERGLGLGCTHVSVAANYEPSEQEKLEQEEDKRPEEEAERLWKRWE